MMKMLLMMLVVMAMLIRVIMMMMIPLMNWLHTDSIYLIKNQT